MTTLMLPARLLAEAGSFFEACGTRGFEGTAMIKAGGPAPELVIPDQRPQRTGYGQVSVEVTRTGQMQLALALGGDELYVARIHSHPDEAFHSAADDANPMLVHKGALSIVVPFFGLGLRRGLNACAVLRHDPAGWRKLEVGQERDRWIRVEPELP